MLWNPETTPNFTIAEMMCKCGCGQCYMDQAFMHILQRVRLDVGFSLVVSSGYRCKDHPEELKKEKPGSHFHGTAGDIKGLHAGKRFILMASAIQHGIIGIGSGKNVIHLDSGHPWARRPAQWGY